MDVAGIRRTTEESPVLPGMTLFRYRVDGPEPGMDIAVIDAFDFADLPATAGSDPAGVAAFSAAFSGSADLAVQPGGWQSWSAGWELAGRERLPRRVRLVPELIRYTNRDGDDPGRGETVGHFIMYLRAGDRYLCLASRDGADLPPVSWRIDRRRRRITVEVYAEGKVWADGQTVAEIHLFCAEGFFALKDTLGAIYRHSGGPVPREALPGGYASWYNHYTRIDEKVILRDLEALGSTDNLINLRFVRRGLPTLFQIDDGWERAVGDWEIDGAKFPRGLRPVADRIAERGYIPGLWLAPFLVTRRARVFSEKPDWLLRDPAGRPVTAGFNDQWDNRFFCLDLSRPDVLAYLRAIVDRAVDDWGFRFLKLDFMYAGLLGGRFAAGGAAYEHYARACALLTARTAAADGAGVSYLGCGVPFGPSYPWFPLSRIGADTRETWDWPKVRLLGHVGRPSAYISLLDTIGRTYLDGTVFNNDPDVLFLRTANCALDETEKELIALVNFMLAGQLMFSDDTAALQDGDLALTRRLNDLFDALGTDEYGAVRLERDVFRLESRSGRLRGLVNLKNRDWTLRAARQADLFTFLAAGTALVDHRTAVGATELRFARRSITLIAEGGTAT